MGHEANRINWMSCMSYKLCIGYICCTELLSPVVNHNASC